MKDFRDLVVWQKSIEVFEMTAKDVKTFPKTEIGRIIADQVLRSVSSISANIAEGYGRRRGSEYVHYLYIARGSANETIDWYEKLKRLKYVKRQSCEKMIDQLEQIRAMLTTMINKVSR